MNDNWWVIIFRFRGSIQLLCYWHPHAHLQYQCHLSISTNTILSSASRLLHYHQTFTRDFIPVEESRLFFVKITANLDSILHIENEAGESFRVRFREGMRPAIDIGTRISRSPCEPEVIVPVSVRVRPAARVAWRVERKKRRSGIEKLENANRFGYASTGSR